VTCRFISVAANVLFNVKQLMQLSKVVKHTKQQLV